MQEPLLSVGLPLPGVWEVLTLLALSAAAAGALLFCADVARRRRSPLPGNAADPWLAHAAACAFTGQAASSSAIPQERERVMLTSVESASTAPRTAEATPVPTPERAQGTAGRTSPA